MGRDVKINVGAKNNASSVFAAVAKKANVLKGSIRGLSTSASAGFNRIGGAALTMGGSVTAGFTVATKMFAGAGDELDKMSKRTGVSVEGLSELSFAAEQSGSSLGVIEKGIKGMQRSLFDAERGSAEMVDSLAELGLQSSDLAGKLPEDQFTMLADKIGGIEDPSKRAAIAMKLFGKSGAEMLPLFSEGAGGIAKLRKEAKELGRQMSTEDASSAAALTDSINRMKSVAVGAAVRIGASLAPTLTGVFNKVAEGTRVISSFIDKNRSVVGAVAAVAAGVTIAGTAFLGIGGSIAIAGAALSGLIGVATTVATVIGTVFSPIGLVIGGVTLAVVGLGAAFAVAAHKTGLLSGVMDSAKKILADVWATAKVTFEGISIALKAGDWQLSAQIAWAGIKVAFWQGLGNIATAFASMMPKMWETVKHFFTRFVSVAWESTKTVSKILANPMSAAMEAANFVSTGLSFGGTDTGIAGYMMEQTSSAKAELASLMDAAKTQADAVQSIASQKPATTGVFDAGKDAGSSFLKGLSDQAGIFDVGKDAGSSFIAGISSQIKDAKGLVLAGLKVAEPAITAVKDQITKAVAEAELLASGNAVAGAGKDIDKDVNKPSQQNQELQATTSRLLTGGRNNDASHDVAENTKQANKILKTIEAHTKPRPPKPSNAIEMVIVG